MNNVVAIVLAAGESRRMGRPKMILPWGKSTVIVQVLNTLIQAGVGKVIVVTGGHHLEMEQALDGYIYSSHLRLVHNPDFANGEMLRSLQVGLKVADNDVQAALIALGDQPQMQVEVVKKVLQVYQLKHAGLVFPSYQMRRGHPWIIDRRLWAQLLSLRSPQTLRDFTRLNESMIEYLLVDNDSIYQDMDTPEDYERMRPV